MFTAPNVDDDLAVLRSRVRFTTAVMTGTLLLFAISDPFIAPHVLGKLYALKAAQLLAFAWLYRAAVRATSHAALAWRTVSVLILSAMVVALSSLLAGDNWHATALGSAIAVGAAGLMPWGVGTQAALAIGIFIVALVPIAIRGEGMWLPFLMVNLSPVVWSVPLAWQMDHYRRQSRQRLRAFIENLERMRLITEHIHGVFWLSELDGTLLYVSRRFEDIWGQPRHLLQDAPRAWMEAVHPDDQVAVAAWVRNTAVRGEHTCEYRLLRSDGVERSIRDAAFPIVGAHGGLWRTVRFTLDVTTEKEAAMGRRMQDLARNHQAAVEEERKRMARELHDELGQTLTGIKLLLSSVQTSTDTAAAENSRRVGVCLGEVDNAMKSLRAMIQALRPLVLDELGLVAALRAQAEGFTATAGIPCDLELPDEGLELSDEEVTTVFRITQEALTNIARHAEAHSVRVRLAVGERRLQLRVEDDGKGIPPGPGNFGLRGMRERAALLDGSLDIRPGSDGGTLVCLDLPRRKSRLAASHVHEPEIPNATFLPPG